ncbi:glycosyltransferase [Streptomyces alanosinicus]|nr:glycosyltransferase [Streptomyces alanosinicus]
MSAAGRVAILRDAAHLGLRTEIRAAPPTDPGYPISGWVSSAVYTRLAIPDVIPHGRRVLYLDTDTPVLSDLRPLLRHSVHGHPQSRPPPRQGSRRVLSRPAGVRSTPGAIGVRRGGVHFRHLKPSGVARRPG